MQSWLSCYLTAVFGWFTVTSWARRMTPNGGTCTGSALVKVILVIFFKYCFKCTLFTLCHPAVLTQSLHSTAVACPVSSSAAIWMFHSATTCSTSCSTVKVSILYLESLEKSWTERFYITTLLTAKASWETQRACSVESVIELVLHVR